MMWISWFRRRRWENHMDSEFRFHLDSLVREYVSQGLSREAAERRARCEFGALELAKDECRDQRPAQWLDHFGRDVRYACRSLRRSPGFVAAAIVTLALGIGANAAIFSVVYAVLWKPLPYFQPDRVYRVGVAIPERRDQFASLPARMQDFLEWRKANTAFSSIADLTPVEWSRCLWRDQPFGGLPNAEIGLRVALGATSGHVLRGLLFGIAPADPISLGGVGAILLLTSSLACYLPARRAAHLDPMAALRYG